MLIEISVSIMIKIIKIFLQISYFTENTHNNLVFMFIEISIRILKETMNILTDFMFKKNTPYSKLVFVIIEISKSTTITLKIYILIKQVFVHRFWDFYIYSISNVYSCFLY